MLLLLRAKCMYDSASEISISAIGTGDNGDNELFVIDLKKACVNNCGMTAGWQRSSKGDVSSVWRDGSEINSKEVAIW